MSYGVQLYWEHVELWGMGYRETDGTRMMLRSQVVECEG